MTTTRRLAVDDLHVHWSGDGTIADESLIQHNLVRLLTDLHVEAPQRREPTIGMARQWHRRALNGVHVPVHYFRGGIRDSDPSEPELVDYPIGVITPTGIFPGVPPDQVWPELVKFESEIQARVQTMDLAHPNVDHAVTTGTIIDVLNLVAWTHGEWVRIHPFVNGNGRTARIWANWVALRYGLPAFIRLRPRPQGATYESAAGASMRGDHRFMEIEVVRLIEE
jgi:fido (protein-threonine AMPylation protein)